jgi:post-segregation antitoxin (ccd killing protein)
VNKLNKQWRDNNPDKIAEIHSFRRELGFNPWNKPFKNSEAHHLNKEDVIYIPIELHKSVKHSLKTGLNMSKINELAIKFLHAHLR